MKPEYIPPVWVVVLLGGIVICMAFALFRWLIIRDTKRADHAYKVWVAQQPPAPCGDDKTHQYWTYMNWPCPRCKADQTKKRKTADREALAHAIAVALAVEMQRQQAKVDQERLAQKEPGNA